MKTLAKLTGPTSRYSLIQGTYWGCYAVINTYASVYLLFRGFSNTQIGVIISLSSVLSALLQPLVSRVADHLRRMPLRQFTALLILLQLPAGLLLLALPGHLPQTLLYGLLLVLIQLVLPLCSALGMACLNHGLPLDFGIARAGGSICFGLFSALCGRLVLWCGEISLPVAMTVLNALFFLSVFTFRWKAVEEAPRPVPAEAHQGQRSGRPFLLQYHGMVWVLVGIVCLLISHNVLNTFAIQIIAPLGGDSGQMGTAILIQALVELPVMFLFTWMLKRANSRLWLRLSGIGFFLHAFGTLLSPNVLGIYLAQIFEMPGYAVFTLSSIYFINEAVREDQRVQGQAWIAMAMTLGNVLSSFFGGMLLDWGGASLLLVFGSAAGAVGMLLFWFLLAGQSKTMTPVE